LRTAAREAVPALKRAFELDPKNDEAHASLAEAYRKQRLFQAALVEADAAIKVDAKSSEGYYNRRVRACSARQNQRRNGCPEKGDRFG
jgi:tetratricopeptide (TPR) repeat protein